MKLRRNRPSVMQKAKGLMQKAKAIPLQKN
jgi:hypothetical protein